MTRRKRYTVAIDFDGTICEHAFPDVGELKEGAKEAIAKIYDEYEVVISSCRTSAVYRDTPDRKRIISEMIEFLRIHEIPYDRIDMGDEGKVVAHTYIDDRAVKFDGWDKEYLL